METGMNPKCSEQHLIAPREERSSVAVPLFQKKTSEVTKIPVLCKFWQEDGVWNGEAQDLAVAVFGDTFEDAQRHLSDAIICHLEALQELKQLKQTIAYLQQRARDFNVSAEEIPSNRPFLRMDATFHDNQLSMTV